MNLQQQQKAKRKINELFQNDGANKKAIFNLFNELFSEFGPVTHTIENKAYKRTQNAFESDLMLHKRASDNNYIFETYLKEVKNGQ